MLRRCNTYLAGPGGPRRSFRLMSLEGGQEGTKVGKSWPPGWGGGVLAFCIVKLEQIATN